MKALVVVDSHIFKTPDNKYWCKGITDKSFFERYLTVFSSIEIVSRVQEIEKVEDGKYIRVDGENIGVSDMPFARGMKEYAKKYSQFKTAAKKAVLNCDCAIFRLPSVLSFIVLDAYKKTKKPFSIEVVACPKQAYQDILPAKLLFTNKLRKAAKTANGASYVTKYYLQETYPSYARLHGSDKLHFETHYSSIDLHPEFIGKPKDYSYKTNKFILTHTANSSSSTAKGQDVLIKALGKITNDGYNAKIQFIGDSEIKDYYMNIAKEFGVEDKIAFTGMLSGKDAIRAKLIEADIFVLPTKAEGLPRCVIEAMAVGLPCISTPVNGVPELLDKEFLVQQSDYEGFANKIEWMIDNPQKLNELSAENIEKSKDYLYNILQKRRIEFYENLYKLAKENC